MRAVVRRRGGLERAVMSVLWSETDPVAARTVLRRLGDSGLAYTTVKTVLERLTLKGVVSRIPVGRTWHYRATASREAYTAELMLRALDDTRDRDGALVRFARPVSRADAHVLRAALDEQDGTSR
jgi:predicted transcriptional regulator